jgi:UDP-N-acetylglucosamine pyrophosphorylase
MIDSIPSIYKGDQAARDLGTEMIESMPLGFLTLAGGQGTRLGFGHPKGMFPTPLGKTLFELYAERLQAIKGHYPTARIVWYVMLSDATRDETVRYFVDRESFSLEVLFFSQSNAPCCDEQGQPIVESYMDGRPVLAQSPNGSGGLYEALHREGVLTHMEQNGIRYVQVVNVDNLNCRPLDPMMLGIAHLRRLRCLCKAIDLHMYDMAGCGRFCLREGRPGVVEYFEISDGERTRLNLGNLAVYLYEFGFLKECVEHRGELPIHRSHKKIPYYDPAINGIVRPTSNNGYKQETFIFDLFTLCLPEHFGVQPVVPDEEFAPIKNATGQDSPESAHEAYQRGFDHEYYLGGT